MAIRERAREATVLSGLAEEEAAKALILFDLVRCPQRQVSFRLKPMIGTFYDHLGRLLYAKAQSWFAASVQQLQEYLDHERRSHHTEGYVGEYILPNWTIYSRESTLYTDIETHDESADTYWNDPLGAGRLDFFALRPLALEVVEALEALGAFTRQGLQIASTVWGAVNFSHGQDSGAARDLCWKMIQRLEKAKLFQNGARGSHVQRLFDRWQMPMYNLDFKMIDVSLDELKADQQAQLWTEIGY